MPKTSTPSIISEVAIGRRIKGSEMLIGDRLLVYWILVGYLTVSIPAAALTRLCPPGQREQPG